MTPRLRLLSLVAVVLVAAAGLIALAAGGADDDGPRPLEPGRGATASSSDPLAYRSERRADVEQRAAAGLAHVLYAKSPGGAVATAERVDRWRPLVEAAAERHDVDPDTLEAMVFLESAGREDATASDDLEGAAGLTQILAETATNLLDLRVDVEASERLTRGIRRGRKVAERVGERRRVDERFDPAKALDATGRYLRFAKEQLGRDDLAVQSYHMGVGNLQRALKAYGDDDVPYTQLFFDSTPLRHREAYEVLAGLGDDSRTYLFRVMAAREMMGTWRHEPVELATLAAAHARKASAEEVLHPPALTPPFASPEALDAAARQGQLRALEPELLAEHGLRVDPQMGELSRRPSRYRRLRPEALALALYLGRGVQEVSGTSDPLTITSAVRDLPYQDRIIRSGNREATRGFSLHTTGWAFDVSRNYASRKQALAFQFWLDRLQALDLIAWVREPGAIHITVARGARPLVTSVLATPRAAP
ncbi:transglycosylase SLT domain-containing protein [Conexibacter sp. SYSU D00693]|uniref:transglycosylase SLT domain-containing protein n=1 Tax=Conexibacter sp. SYSU D00693 TaxID=2812560 RepID=UPI00196B2C96|nr:transglycosylase SLT domain-containing protein [Conexibacter sp. SYSU D00693]